MKHYKSALLFSLELVKFEFQLINILCNHYFNGVTFTEPLIKKHERKVSDLVFFLLKCLEVNNYTLNCEKYIIYIL